jgi:hypothetical protein
LMTIGRGLSVERSGKSLAVIDCSLGSYVTRWTKRAKSRLVRNRDSQI